jgi:hypothetical protein
MDCGRWGQRQLGMTMRQTHVWTFRQTLSPLRPLTAQSKRRFVNGVQFQWLILPQKTFVTASTTWDVRNDLFAEMSTPSE